MKKVFVLACIGAIIFIFAYNANKSFHQTSNHQSLTPTPTNDVDVKKINDLILSLTPTPSIPFDMKQQCLNDANTLVNNKQQKANTQWSYAAQFHRGYTTVELKKSAFSPELNTCVTEFDETVVQDGTSLDTTYVYDTVNNKILAQIITPDTEQSSFLVSLKGQMIKNPNWADLANYESSIGL